MYIITLMQFTPRVLTPRVFDAAAAAAAANATAPTPAPAHVTVPVIPAVPVTVIHVTPAPAPVTPPLPAPTTAAPSLLSRTPRTRPAHGVRRAVQYLDCLRLAVAGRLDGNVTF
ncbi:hypothetical protein DL771_003861 [Monosporascus sp. 5C6A]|nr:hypothetical protein DL771_003861 [Monosporascus sp. 5C6A]